MADLGFREDASAEKELGFVEDPTAFARKSKHPQPRSMTASDEELGLRTGPISSARVPGTALSVPLRPDMSEVESEHLNDQAIDAVQRTENAAGAAALGGVAGMAARGASAAPVAARIPGFGPAAAAAAPKAGNALQTAILGALLGQGFGGSGAVAGGITGLLTPMALRAIGHAPAAVQAGLPAIGAGGAGAAEVSGANDAETEIQRAVRLLLGQQPTFPQGE